METARFKKSAEECKSELDCLLYWFTHSGQIDMVPEIIKRSPYASRLADASEIASMTENQKLQYDCDMINELDIAYQKRQERLEAFTKGKNAGIEIGREEGRTEGIEIGAEMGRKEEKLSIASNFKKIGIPVEQIAEATGLSAEEIKKL